MLAEDGILMPGFGDDGVTGPLRSCRRSKGSLAKALWLIHEGGVAPVVVGGLDMNTDIGGTWPCINNDPNNWFFFVRFGSSPWGVLLASYEAGMFTRERASMARRRSIFGERDGTILNQRGLRNG